MAFDVQQLMKIAALQQGLDGLGTAFGNIGRLQRGEAMEPIQSNPYALMQMAQMQQQAQQQQRAQSAIDGLQGVDPNVKAVMSAYPEETARAFISAQMRPEKTGARYMSTAAGLYDTEEKRIVEGTAPRGPGMELRQIPDGDNIVTYAMDPTTGDGRVVATAPRWNPRAGVSGGGGGGGGAPLASQFRSYDVTVPGPDGQPITTTQFYAVQPQRGAPPIVTPAAAPGKEEAEPTLTKEGLPPSLSEKYVEAKGILDTARSSLETMKNFKPDLPTKLGAQLGVFGPEGAAAESARAASLFAVAKLAEQGALQAPDKAVAEAMIGKAFDLRISEEARRSAISEYEKWLNAREQANELRRSKIKGQTPAAPAAPEKKRIRLNADGSIAR